MRCRDEIILNAIALICKQYVLLIAFNKQAVARFLWSNQSYKRFIITHGYPSVRI